MTRATPRKPLDVTGRRIAAGSSTIDDFTYCVVEPAPGDRRGDRRSRTRLRDGIVGERRGHVLVDCRIRDLSKRGARLRLDEDRPLPRTFLLTDSASRARYWAILVWQVARDAGVKLSKIEDL